MKRKKNQIFIIREYLILFLFLVLSIVLIFSTNSSFINQLRISGLNAFSILKMDVYNLKNKELLEDENTLLKKRVIDLISKNNSYRKAKLENDRYRQLLNIKRDDNYEYIHAKVIGYNPDKSRSIILINIGYNDNNLLNINDPVVTINGLVGKVVSVGAYISRVELVSKKRNKIPVKTGNKNIPSILVSIDSDASILKEITKSQSVELNETIYTSDFSLIYPGGIEIGKISSISDSSATIHKEISVKFSVDLKNIDDLFVLIKKNDENN